MSGDLVFELDGGSVSLGSNLVLDGVDFTLAPGEFLALLGANGSGKTTLIRALLGLVPLAGGRVNAFGTPLKQFRQWSRIGYVPQRMSAVSEAPASVMEVALSGRIAVSRRLRPYGAADRAAARDALCSLGLEQLANVPIARLSGGQQQRVLIARALAGEPDVLVLDEPFSGVDIEHQEKLADTLRKFNQSGRAVLLVAHGLGHTEHLITREVVMQSGRVAYTGPHHPDHVHAEHIHHPHALTEGSALDRAAKGR